MNAHADPQLPAWIASAGPDALLRIKAVPGASRECIAGPLGDRLKVRIAAPAEGGRANRAICALVARSIGVRTAQVAIESGHGSAEKVLRIAGVAPAAVALALTDVSSPGRGSPRPER